MGVKAGQIFKITHGFTDWSLNDPNQGRQEFFKMIMEELENCKSGFSTFNLREPMPSGAGGFFTNRFALDKLAIPDIVDIDESNKTLTFRDEVPPPTEDEDEHEEIGQHNFLVNAEEAWAIFVHEACHFLHFSRDNGVYEQPLMKGQSSSMDEIAASMKLRRACEYEAGYRSIKFNLIYDMTSGNPRQYLDVNLRNMFHYDSKHQSKEWKEKFNSDIRPWYDDLKGIDMETGKEEVINGADGKPLPGKLIDVDSFKAYMDNIYQRVQKFKEWADPKHEILGVLN